MFTIPANIRLIAVLSQAIYLDMSIIYQHCAFLNVWKFGVFWCKAQYHNLSRNIVFPNILYVYFDHPRWIYLINRSTINNNIPSTQSSKHSSDLFCFTFIFRLTIYINPGKAFKLESQLTYIYRKVWWWKWLEFGETLTAKQFLACLRLGPSDKNQNDF